MSASRTRIMGVINVTPDSFSDGGKWFDPDRAVARGLELRAAGADLLDVGGESTRPGARRVTEEEEVARVVPVLAGLRHAGVPLSVDTMRAEVAAAALEAGAEIVNDVSGGLADPDMIPLVADHGCTYILSHWRGHSRVMDDLARYDDVVTEVLGELLTQVDRALAGGVRREQIVIDPGLGFAKDAAANWQIIAHLAEFMAPGYPLLIGASRKRFLGELLQGSGRAVPPTSRDQATAAVTAIAAHHGVWGVRVHEVSPSADAVLVAEAIRMANNSLKEER